MWKRGSRNKYKGVVVGEAYLTASCLKRVDLQCLGALLCLVGDVGETKSVIFGMFMPMDNPSGAELCKMRLRTADIGLCMNSRVPESASVPECYGSGSHPTQSGGAHPKMRQDTSDNTNNSLRQYTTIGE